MTPEQQKTADACAPELAIVDLPALKEQLDKLSEDAGAAYRAYAECKADCKAMYLKAQGDDKALASWQDHETKMAEPLFDAWQKAQTEREKVDVEYHAAWRLSIGKRPVAD